MQSNRSSVNIKRMLYVSLFTVALLRLLFAGFMFWAAIDSKTLAVSYGLIVVSAVVIVFTLRKLINILLVLRRVARITIQEDVVE